MSGPRQPSAGKKKSTDNLTWQTLNSLPLNQVSCSGKKSCLVNLPDKMIITWDGSLIPHPNGMTMTSLCFSLSLPPPSPLSRVSVTRSPRPRDTITSLPWHMCVECQGCFVVCTPPGLYTLVVMIMNDKHVHVYAYITMWMNSHHFTFSTKLHSNTNMITFIMKIKNQFSMKKGFRLRRKKKKKVTIVTLEDA